MKKTLRLLMLMALSVLGAGLQAQTTYDASWTFENLSGNYSSQQNLNGLIIEASSDKNVSVDGSSKTVTLNGESVEYTKRLKFGGAGDANFRNVHFSVSGPCTIYTVAAHASSSGDSRTLKISFGGFGTEAADYGSLQAGADPVVLSYEYTGTGTKDIYIYSGNSGINLYGIYVKYKETFAGQYSVTQSHDYSQIASGHSEYDGWAAEPKQGTYTFTGAGTINGGHQITEVPGITMTVGAAGDNNWTVTSDNVNNYSGSYPYVTNPNEAARWGFKSGCFYKFEPVVNGYLSFNGKTLSNNTWLAENSTTSVAVSLNGNSSEYLVKAGHTYYLCAKGAGIHLHSFSFRPAFLAPDDYNTEQTAEFAAGVGTTAYPKVLTEANSNVSHWARRDVASITSTGDVTINGNGWTIVGSNVYQPGNSDRHLTAIYTMQTSVLEVTSTSPANGSTPETSEVNVIDFTFDQAITLNSNYKITLTVDGATMEYTQDHVALEGTKTIRLSVNNNYIHPGNTFTVTLAAGSVYATSDPTLLNAEKKITFTLNSDEPVVTMVYPTNTTSASIGTAIALNLDKGDVKDIKDQVVVGTLSAEGEEPMTLYAFKDGHNYVFKPTRSLTPNTKYTIFVEGNQMTTTSNAVVTHDKSFSFTTGNAAGTAPTLASSWPADGEIVDASHYASGTYTMTFDQKIKIEPYTTVRVTPVNGSEDCANGSYFLVHYLDPDNKIPTLKLVNDNTLKIDYTSGISSEGIRWDLVHKVEIPANSVTTSGGMPNPEPIKFYFRMSKNPAARNLTQTDLPYIDGKHPYTWDFNNFGQLTGTYNNLDDVIQTAGGTSTNDARAMKTIWTKSYVTGTNNDGTPKYKFSQDNIALYAHQDAANKFVQGTELFYMNTESSEKFYMDEFRGLRVSIKNLRQNDRIQIRYTKEYGKSFLYFVGNTHYITIPDVPSNARVYILGQSHRKLKDNPDPDASGGRFTINSKNATFVQNWDENNGQEYADISDTKNNKVYIIDMDPEGCAAWGNDLTFCISDFSINKIAISVDDKELTEYAGIAYATDCQEYPVEYKLTKDFGMGDITGMYILSGDSQNAGVNSSSSSIFSTDIKYAAGVDRNENGMNVHQGTIVKATAPNSSSDTKYNGKYLFPYFTTDVNTLPDELYIWDAENAEKMTGNMLVGVLEDPYTVLSRETEDNEICYVFTATRYTTDANGNLSYMQPKDDKKWNKEAPVQEGDKWYITETDGTKVEVTYDETKKVYYLLDENGNKMPKVKVANLPSFQPVMRKGQTASGADIDTGNLEESVWQLGPNKSYLKLTKGTSVNEVVFLNGEGDEEILDGINTVNNGVMMESGAWYTLQGVKLNGTPKQQGIYIYNNKKVLIK